MVHRQAPCAPIRPSGNGARTCVCGRLCVCVRACVCVRPPPRAKKAPSQTRLRCRCLLCFQASTSDHTPCHPSAFISRLTSRLHLAAAKLISDLCERPCFIVVPPSRRNIPGGSISFGASQSLPPLKRLPNPVFGQRFGPPLVEPVDISSVSPSLLPLAISCSVFSARASFMFALWLPARANMHPGAPA